eukprot:3521810-Prorocentrum_lima.AAC.1
MGRMVCCSKLYYVTSNWRFSVMGLCRENPTPDLPPGKADQQGIRAVASTAPNKTCRPEGSIRRSR